MRTPRVATVDFETEGIQSRPTYPPKPVGVSILLPGAAKAKYLAWGHPTGNNTTKTDATRVLRQLWKDELLLFHNGKFDVDVAETHLGLRQPAAERIHDTQFLLFLSDPHAASLSLKPSAERVLGITPDERDELHAWLIEHVPEVRQKPSSAGAYISRAPAELVGKYANGDTARTRKLFYHLWPWLEKWTALQAYQREQKLMPILLNSERQGVRLALDALAKDVALYQADLEKMEHQLRKALKAKDLNLDSEELLPALVRARWVDEAKLLRTPKGDKASASKESLRGAMRDTPNTRLLAHRNKLATLLNTFMEPWLARGNDRLFPNWHQVRAGYGEKQGNGARTGRIICTDPNLLNLAKGFEDRDDGYVHPGPEWQPLPLVRRYMLPDKGHVWVHRDYNQQELRILAHYEDGALKQAYADNPRLDVHNYVRDAIHQVVGVMLERRPVKVLNFGMIYGMGIPALSGRLRIAADEAKRLKAAQLKGVPGLKDLQTTIKEIAKADEPIYTWGGRPYWPEPPKLVNGELRDFIYKLLNYLIQGSAADCTKEAVIRYHSKPCDSRFLVTVYDEINTSSPKGKLKQENKWLQECMESIEFDVPMLSDGKTGPNWAEVE